MAISIPDILQKYVAEGCDCKYRLRCGDRSNGSRQCLAGTCICEEELDDALRREQLASPITYVFIKFTENMKPGSSRPWKDIIAIEMEPTFQKLGFYNMKSPSRSTVFHCWNHERFGELLKILRDWEKSGIKASSVKRFERPIGWDTWRRDVFFTEKDVHWQILIEYANGTCATYVHRDVLFPKELRTMYELAKSMNPKK